MLLKLLLNPSLLSLRRFEGLPCLQKVIITKRGGFFGGGLRHPTLTQGDIGIGTGAALIKLPLVGKGIGQGTAQVITAQGLAKLLLKRVDVPPGARLLVLPQQFFNLLQFVVALCTDLTRLVKSFRFGQDAVQGRTLVAQKGVSAVITNPIKLTSTIRAIDLLLGRDEYSMRYIKHFRATQKAKG